MTTTGFPTPALTDTGTLPTGVTFVDNGNGTATLASTTATPAGSTTLTITAANGVTPNATQTFTLTVSQAPAITSATSTTFTVGKAGSFTVTASGVPTPSLSETGTLPGGVTFNAATGVLSGTPAAGTGGTYSLTLHRLQRRRQPRHPELYPHGQPGAGDHQRHQHHLHDGDCGQLHGDDHRLPDPGADRHRDSTHGRDVRGQRQRDRHSREHDGHPRRLHHADDHRRQRRAPQRHSELHADGQPGDPGADGPDQPRRDGGPNQVSLSWTASTDPAGVTGYAIYRQSPGSDTFVDVGTAASTTYTDTGLAASSTYSYEVQAADAAGKLSPFSNVATTATTATITGLVAAYSFNAGTGTTVTDSSGNGNNGTISNATWTTAGVYGDALVFNGTNARVNIPDAASLHLTTGMTLEAWVNPSTVPSTWVDVVYKGDDNYYLEATTPNGVPAAGATVGTSDVAAYGTTALTASTWAFLTETYNGSTLALYVNGRRSRAWPRREASRPRPTRSRSAATASTPSTSKGRSTRSASTTWP